MDKFLNNRPEFVNADEVIQELAKDFVETNTIKEILLSAYYKGRSDLWQEMQATKEAILKLENKEGK